jgi:hypothetical protein
MKMILKDTYAKTQRRKETQMSKAQPFFAPLRLCASICMLSFAVGALAQRTNDLSDAEIQGQQLAQQILEQRPATNSTLNGILNIREKRGNLTNVSVKYEAIVYPTKGQRVVGFPTNWVSRYKASLSNPVKEELSIVHTDNSPNRYFHDIGSTVDYMRWNQTKLLPGDQDEQDEQFAGSDFWICDLGLEFFHWPAQKVLKKEVHRSRGCVVLESTNPNPSTNGYSRVVSWIDEESLGIVEAYAYDANGKLLKDFYPKDFKKVNGQWQVQTLVMENVQTGSRSRLEFDLNKP